MGESWEVFAIQCIDQPDSQRTLLQIDIANRDGERKRIFIDSREFFTLLTASTLVTQKIGA